ncbi:GTPase [Sediminicola luteus]|uniref:GTPase n=1 Tax=Sediminicola luteus TaxID=319238 RepID=A0A2A4GED6_9FLAO|nr:GTPase [Sediminicola luteus]PCE66368.1 hypothetical protein B7P33_03470 [Sediminicola luteus]
MSQLLFVYNAEPGLGHALVDSLHKWLSPGTYSCSLCALTHGGFGKKKDWAEYLDNIPLPKRFVYKDAFIKEFGTRQVPAIYLEHNQNLHSLITAEQLQTTDLLGLMETLTTQLKKYTDV